MPGRANLREEASSPLEERTTFRTECSQLPPSDRSLRGVQQQPGQQQSVPKENQSEWGQAASPAPRAFQVRAAASCRDNTADSSQSPRVIRSKRERLEQMS